MHRFVRAYRLARKVVDSFRAMMGLLFRNRATPVISGERVILRGPSRQDHKAWANLRQESRAFLTPLEPAWVENELSKAMFAARRIRAAKEAAAGTGFVFFIFSKQTQEIMGGISLSYIRYGAARSGQIGYWMGEKFSGKGLMQEAVKLLVEFGFSTLKLHRIEAACVPNNIRSIKVLEKTGFSQEGLLKSYLKINGEWQDHLLFARISGLTG